MKQATDSYYQPFSQRPFQIWNELDVRQKAALTIIYQLDQDSECREHQHLREKGCCRPSDDWRWIPFSSCCTDTTTVLQTRLRKEIGIDYHEALAIFQILELRGLIRSDQDRWAADDRLFVRILFLGQRVVREGFEKY